MKKSTESAFTLLEVLAAVAILGIWFSVLASIAIQGQRSEGENERRIRASLLADQTLMELELGFDEGSFPEDGTEEKEQDEFIVRIETGSMENDELVATDEFFSLLLQGDLANLAADLYTVRVAVSWQEGHEEVSVTRFTYAWDPSGVEEAIEQALRENPDALGAALRALPPEQLRNAQPPDEDDEE